MYRFTVTNLPREYLAQIAISFFFFIIIYFVILHGLELKFLILTVQYKFHQFRRFLVGILEACLSQTQEEIVLLGTRLGREGRVPSLGL